MSRFAVFSVDMLPKGNSIYLPWANSICASHSICTCGARIKNKAVTVGSDSLKNFTYQCINSESMIRIIEPKTGIRIEPIDQVLRLVLISIPEKFVTTWKYESLR